VLTRSKEHIPTFEEYCARAEGRIDLMVDIKGASDRWLEAYTRQVDQALTRHRLLENTLFIINQFPVNNQEKVVPWFLGRAKISWRSSLQITEILRPHMSDPAKYYFVFNSPAELSKEEIDGFHKLGMKVIPSVNTQDYPPADAVKHGLEDIKKMMDYGVDGLQIDSVYDPLVFERLKQR
jgi:glycerophosphoryl diester phosphodiesterase